MKDRKKPHTTGAQVADLLKKRLLTVPEFGMVLGVSERTAWAMIRSGEVTVLRVGRQVRVEPAAIENYIDRQRPR